MKKLGQKGARAEEAVEEAELSSLTHSFIIIKDYDLRHAVGQRDLVVKASVALCYEGVARRRGHNRLEATLA